MRLLRCTLAVFGADEQPAADLAVRQPFRDEGQDLPLPLGQHRVDGGLGCGETLPAHRRRDGPLERDGTHPLRRGGRHPGVGPCGIAVTRVDQGRGQPPVAARLLVRVAVAERVERPLPLLDGRTATQARVLGQRAGVPRVPLGSEVARGDRGRRPRARSTRSRSDVPTANRRGRPRVVPAPAAGRRLVGQRGEPERRQPQAPVRPLGHRVQVALRAVGDVHRPGGVALPGQEVRLAATGDQGDLGVGVPAPAQPGQPSRRVRGPAGDRGVAADGGQPGGGDVGWRTLGRLGGAQAALEVARDVQRDGVEQPELDPPVAPPQAALRDPGHRGPQHRQRGRDVPVVVVQRRERVVRPQLRDRLARGPGQAQADPSRSAAASRAPSISSRNATVVRASTSRPVSSAARAATRALSRTRARVGGTTSPRSDRARVTSASAARRGSTPLTAARRTASSRGPNRLVGGVDLHEPARQLGARLDTLRHRLPRRRRARRPDAPSRRPGPVRRRVRRPGPPARRAVPPPGRCGPSRRPSATPRAPVPGAGAPPAAPGAAWPRRPPGPTTPARSVRPRPRRSGGRPRREPLARRRPPPARPRGPRAAGRARPGRMSSRTAARSRSCGNA